MKDLFRGIATTIIVMALIWSCGKDDGPAPEQKPMNTAPVIAAQSFDASETITDTQTIGIVKATDPDKDELTFSITENSSALFEITDAGALSLQAGKALDFEVANSHEITVSVTDGEEDASALITINVVKVDPENTAPEMEDQFFEVNEDMEAIAAFASIVAEDIDENELTFSLTVDESELFAVSENGEISLVEGASLDFETTQEYNITVQVTDGNLSTEATITISVQNINEAPVAEAALQFEVSEDIDDTVIIGSVTATDPDNDTLDYSISENDNGLFEISETGGEISLADNQTLDFETKTEHSIQVSVTDGEFIVHVDVTIVVENALADDSDSFVTTLEILNPNQIITIDVFGNVDFQLSWGDASDQESVNSEGQLFHEYTTPGIYTVAIKGQVDRLSLSGQTAFKTVEQWGTIPWKSMEYMFTGTNIQIVSTDKPDLSQCTSLRAMFQECALFNNDISNWDVSNVSDMLGMFSNSSFNGDISNWDVGNVTNMSGMFYGNTAFNGNISNWNVSYVTDMSNMFQDATAFDQDLGGWDIGSIETMENMFDNSGMAPPNSNTTLVGWANFVDQNAGPTNIALGMQNIVLCGMGADYALGVLINDHSWNISGFDMQFNLCP